MNLVLSTLLGIPLPRITLDPKAVLTPGHGWSAQDCQRQLKALDYFDGVEPEQVVAKSCAKIGELRAACQRSARSAAGLLAASAVAMSAAFLAGPSLVGAALAGAAVVGTFRGVDLLGQMQQERNNSNIMCDMASRLDQATFGKVEFRQPHQGGYLADFNLARG